MFSNRLEGFDFSYKSLLALCCGFATKSSTKASEQNQASTGYDSSCDEADSLRDRLRGSRTTWSDYSLGSGEESEKRQKKRRHRKKEREKESIENELPPKENESKENGKESDDGEKESQEKKKERRVKKKESREKYKETGENIEELVEEDKETRNEEHLPGKDTKIGNEEHSPVKDTKIGNEEHVPVKDKETAVSQKDASEKEKSGNAYQYDDDSSSDSDDEVLKRYQSAMARSSSIHGSSIKGSKKGEKIKQPVLNGSCAPGEIADFDEQASLLEKGRRSEIVSSAGTDSQHSLLDDPEGSPETVKSMNGEPQEQQSYENKGFNTEQSMSSISGSQQALSTTDPTLSNDEHLFDVSDLQGDPPLISKCGSLEVSFRYEAMRGKMHITIHQAREIPAKDRGGASNVQVRLMLLPTKKQKFKTKVKTGENPVFDETIAFGKIFPDDVNGMGIRVRLYGLERMRRERMIGESIVGFASLNLDEETTHWMVLEPRSNLSHGESGFDVSSLSKSDSASSTQSLQHGGMPELLIGLAYNGTTGRLSVEVIKGSNFRNMAMNRAPDTYVKLTLMSPTGQELQRCKTSVRRGQPNPLFKETFMFQVALFQLPEVTMMISVYNKKSMKKKEMIGWFSLGMNSSGEEEGSHWSDMRESKGDEVCRWHVLLES